MKSFVTSQIRKIKLTAADKNNNSNNHKTTATIASITTSLQTRHTPTPPIASTITKIAVTAFRTTTKTYMLCMHNAYARMKDLSF